MDWVCSVSRNSWIFRQCCASAETPWGGLRPQSAEPGPGELALLQHAQKGCNTACQSPIAAPGSSKKASVPPYCSTQSGKMSGLAMTSGTRAGGSSSRGTPPPCHSAALHPLLGDKGGWNCSTSSRNTCSSDRGMCRQGSPASLAVHSTGTAGRAEGVLDTRDGLVHGNKTQKDGQKPELRMLQRTGADLEITSSPWE